MAKLNLSDIAQGVLVNNIHEAEVEFKHHGKTETVDICIKQLPYAVTEPLFKRLNKGEDVVAEWISKALVDDDGNTYLTQQQVAKNFTPSLAGAVFNKILGIEKPAVDEEGKSD